MLRYLFLLGFAALLAAPDARAQYTHQIGSSSNESAYAVTVDAAGNSYVTGNFESTVDFDPGAGSTVLSTGWREAFLASYTPDGHLRFAHKIGGSGSSSGRALALDAAGNVYVTGYFTDTIDLDPDVAAYERTSAGGDDVFVASYTSAGVFRSGFAIGGAGFEQANALAVDAAGNVIVGGQFTGSADFDPTGGTFALTSAGQTDAFVATYTAEGALSHAYRLGGAQYDVVYALAVDAAGSVFVTGSFYVVADFDPSGSTFTLTSAGGTDIFVASYTSVGALRFAFSISSPSYNNGLGIALDASGNVYVTGEYFGTVDFDPGVGTYLHTAGNRDGYLASYTNAGALRFAVPIGGASTDGGAAVAVDAAGNAYVTGHFTSTVDFDPGPGVTQYSAMNYDLFVASYTSTGAFRSAARAGGTSSDYGFGIATDASGNAVAVGAYSIEEWDPMMMMPMSQSDILVVSAGTPSLPVELVSFEAKLDGSAARLRWVTASETNNAGFDIEHRIGEAGFRTVGFVAGHGKTAEASSYTHAIERLAPGTHTFRLRQVDFDGAFEYSPEVELTIEADGLSLTLYGHPATNAIRGSVAVPQGAARVTLYDALGRKVADQEQTSGAFALGTTALPAGVYVLRVEAGSQTITRQIVVAR